MLERPWSIARLMAATALLALGLTALLALRTPRMRDDPGVGVLALVLALVLTAAADRAMFGRGRRAFWLGFATTGWLCAAVALSSLQETRGYLLRYGPPLVRARYEFQQQQFRVERSRERGIELVEPRASEWYFLSSLVAETSLGLTLGGLIASTGGLLAASAAFVARLASRPVQQSRFVAASGSGEV
jgi:hypothetical protein